MDVSCHRWDLQTLLALSVATISLGAIQVGLSIIVVYLYLGVVSVAYVALFIARMCNRSKNDMYSDLNEFNSWAQPSFTQGAGYQINDASY